VLVQDAENLGVNQSAEDDEGVEEGDCPFVVHTLTGTQYENKTGKQLRALALEHLLHGGKVLGIGHSEKPESTYKNPQLYPQMFPWLFPYGLGGLGNTSGKVKIDELTRKRNLLMYHDKRFQLDPLFPLIAFNHEQVKGATTGGYLLANKTHFPNIANRLLNLSQITLNEIIEKLKNGEAVKPVTEEEKQCYKVLNDLDHVASHVKGSATNKKYMRNEIWALTSYLGAPSWFITFAPADVNHPIALYYADEDISLYPRFYSQDQRFRLIAQNPVAGARFFKLMVELFIKHVLGVKTNHKGLYSNTAGYYGTVEQQGQLTLHLHMLLWIKNALSPQEIRDRLLDPSSDFQKKMIEYLESVHMGEFSTGTMEQVQVDIENAEASDKKRVPPTLTLPDPGPEICLAHVDVKVQSCHQCSQSFDWWQKFKVTVDEILFRSNKHRCYAGCTDPRYNSCKARFPRDTFIETGINPETGSLNLKKGEAWLNTFTNLVTYLLRCNTDVTSLLSGTAIKSTIAYVTDYITKTPLKTHTMFEVVRTVFNRNSEFLSGDSSRHEKARKVMIQLVNSLTVQAEIGAPMASLYLLGHDDHYTSHTFKSFFWKPYVNEAR